MHTALSPTCYKALKTLTKKSHTSKQHISKSQSGQTQHSFHLMLCLAWVFEHAGVKCKVREMEQHSGLCRSKIVSFLSSKF